MFFRIAGGIIGFHIIGIMIIEYVKTGHVDKDIIRQFPVMIAFILYAFGGQPLLRKVFPRLAQKEKPAPRVLSSPPQQRLQKTMMKFAVEARDVTGQCICLSFQAESEDEARRIIQTEGFSLVRIDSIEKFGFSKDGNKL